ncbi:hypothetical protein PbB2_00064 [Candidatus Phycosocius bacilliformis]|uniref:HD domain-containing protein n=2 Tax=Candidatus Phycosocius bacilliformis TaxID=1445552 RepID=A0A2P2E5S6_9PROT|nr:hypothetical protein PbB2_00064 [Candidatus Phycosocius bacilliformis]
MEISGPTILTADGTYFSFLRPSENLTLNAVARGLANTCRFGGQCNRFYSVAEHSVWVSRIVPEELALWGLMHDAPEAFICDIPKPLKEMLPDYRKIEKAIEGPILEFFGLIGPMPSAVKAADMIMLATEQRQIMNNRDPWRWTLKPLEDATLECLEPQAAYELFIARANELGIF